MAIAPERLGRVYSQERDLNGRRPGLAKGTLADDGIDV